MEKTGSPLPCRGALSLATLILLTGLLWLPPSHATAAPVTVTNCNDSGPGSLRAAIAAAGNGDTITFGTDCPSGSPITLTTGTLVINASVTIDATNPPHTVVVDGGCTANCGTASAVGGVTVFQITGGTVTLNGLTIQDGTASVSCANPLFPTGHCGGGIYNAFTGQLPGVNGAVTVTNSTLSGNSANQGGGIASIGGQIAVADTTLSGNTAHLNGGGMYLSTGGGSTSAAVVFATIAGNSAGTTGGGIETSAGVLSLADTILSANTGGDLHGTPAASGNNLIGASPNPLLAPLGNYGGPTQTLALLAGSPAIDAGACSPTYTDPTSSATVTVTSDQRGIARPQGSGCDIGAFESRGFSLTLTSGNNQSTPVGTTFAGPLVVTVAANDPGVPAPGGQVTFTAPASGPSASLSGSPATIGANGQASVTATANGSAGTYTVTAGAAGGVTPGTVGFTLTNTTGVVLVGITVSPTPVILKVGQQQGFRATGTYADSHTADITAQVSWSSDNDPVVHVAPGTSTAIGEAPGSVHVVATLDGMSGQATVTVTPAMAIGIAPVPAPASRASGSPNVGMEGGVTPVPAPRSR